LHNRFNLLNMARTYFSPYAPRRRRPARLVLAWVAMFFIVLYVVWYITSNHREQTNLYVQELMRRGAAMKAAMEAAAMEAAAMEAAGEGWDSGTGAGHFQARRLGRRGTWN
jgi:hypothetical protein